MSMLAIFMTLAQLSQCQKQQDVVLGTMLMRRMAGMTLAASTTASMM